jgi:hypothetical protein
MSERKSIKKQIHYDTNDKPFTWKMIKHIVFQDDDTIHIGYDEGHVSENNSWDPHHFICVERMVPETDEEMKERIRCQERDKEWAKERRYQSYIKLKQEFEGQ